MCVNISCFYFLLLSLKPVWGQTNPAPRLTAFRRALLGQVVGRLEPDIELFTYPQLDPERLLKHRNTLVLTFFFLLVTVWAKPFSLTLPILNWYFSLFTPFTNV